MDPSLKPKEMLATPANVLAFLRHYGRAATLEVAAAFGVTDDESEILLEDLDAEGKVVRREVGKGVMWEPPLKTGRSDSLP